MNKMKFSRIGGLFLVALAMIFFTACEREREIDDRAGIAPVMVSQPDPGLDTSIWKG